MLAVNKFDIICLSKIYLNTTILSNDDNLVVPGYTLKRARNPNNTKRGGIYYLNSLPLKVLDVQFLN